MKMTHENDGQRGNDFLRTMVSCLEHEKEKNGLLRAYQHSKKAGVASAHGRDYWVARSTRRLGQQPRPTGD